MNSEFNIKSYIAFQENDKSNAIKFLSDNDILNDPIVKNDQIKNYKILDSNGNYYQVNNKKLILDQSQDPDDKLFMELTQHAIVKQKMIVRYNAIYTYLTYGIFFLIIYGIYYFIKH